MTRDADQILADMRAVAEAFAPKVLLCPPALEDAARELVAHYGLGNVDVQADRGGILPDGTAALMRVPLVVRPLAGGDVDDRDYYDPDPYRHDVPDICCCTYMLEDHSHNDGGCARLQCTCRWYEVDPWR